MLRMQRVGQRWPLLRQLAPLGAKYVLIEALIEIPFLLLELSLWVGPLFGLTLGLNLWQRILLTLVLYILVEGVRWAVAGLRNQPYYLFGAERELLRQAGYALRRRPAGAA